MKVLDSNYTTKTLNSILGNQDLYRERFSDPNRVGTLLKMPNHCYPKANQGEGFNLLVCRRYLSLVNQNNKTLDVFIND
jgi:hypothetical protein